MFAKRRGVVGQMSEAVAIVADFSDTKIAGKNRA